MRALVFGSCNLDIFFRVPRIVAPGETVGAAAVTENLGGKGFNQAVALRRAGMETAFAGNIGADGGRLRAYLEETGVDASLLLDSPAPTGKAYIQVSDDGENAIIIHHGANFTVTPEQVDDALSHFSAGDVILLQNEINGVPEIAEKAVRKGLRVVLNPSPFEESLRRIDLNAVSLLIVNETEAAQLSGGLSPDAFVARMRRDCPALRGVVTLGGAGSVYFDAQTVLRQAAVPTKVADTTGAGDTFTGFFVRSFFTDGDPGRALLTASKAAAIAVSRPGAAPSVPRAEELA